MRTLTFNGRSFADFDTFFDSADLFTTPEKDITFYQIPGKNGDLTISNDRFKNIDRKIECFIRSDFKQNYSDLVNFLNAQEGYGRLEVSSMDDVYMMAHFKGTVAPKTGPYFHFGTFALSFSFKPQRWLKTGENAIPVSASETISNPTLFTAKPLLKVTGTGTININDSELVLAENTSVVYIDCEIEDAYEGTINRNGDLTITNGFPKLYPGDNTVSVTGCTMELIPRWWKL